jgi:hypothetical protein
MIAQKAKELPHRRESSGLIKGTGYSFHFRFHFYPQCTVIGKRMHPPEDEYSPWSSGQVKVWDEARSNKLTDSNPLMINRFLETKFHVPPWPSRRCWILSTLLPQWPDLGLSLFAHPQHLAQMFWHAAHLNLGFVLMSL